MNSNVRKGFEHIKERVHHMKIILQEILYQPHTTSHLDLIFPTVEMAQVKKDYIKALKLKLPEPKLGTASNEVEGEPEPPQSDKEEAYVVAGAAIAFTATVSGQAKDDITHAFLISQLVADHQFKREEQTEQWYAAYKTVLGNLGFVIQSFSFSWHQETGGTFKMSDAVIGIMAGVCSGIELIAITKTMEALKKLDDDDHRIQVLNAHGSGDGKGNFQVGACNQAPNGDVTTVVGAFYYESNAHQGSFLFFSWSTGTTRFYTGTQTCLLDVAVYAYGRADILERLGLNSRKYIANLEF